MLPWSRLPDPPNPGRVNVALAALALVEALVIAHDFLPSPWNLNAVWAIALPALVLTAWFYPSLRGPPVLVTAPFVVFLLASSRHEWMFELFKVGRWWMLGALGILGLGYLRPERLRERLRLPELWGVGWIGLALATVAFSHAPAQTVKHAGTLGFMFAAVFGGLWLVAERQGREAVVDGLVRGILLVLGLSFVLVPFTAGSFDAGFRGITINPNALGLVLAVTFPLVVYRATGERDATSIFIVLLVAGTLLATQARGSILAAAAGGGFVLWRQLPRPWARVTGTLAVGGVGLVGAATAGILPVELSMLDLGEILRGTGRYQKWSIGFSYLSEHWFTGLGFGNEPMLLANYEDHLFYYPGHYMHNSYLGLAIQTGVVGAALFYLPLLGLLGLRLRSSPTMSTVDEALTAVLVISLVTGLFESWHYVMGNLASIPFWTTVVLLVKGHREGAWNDDSAARRPSTAESQSPDPRGKPE